MARQYSSIAAQTTLTSSITSGQTSIQVQSVTGWPSAGSLSVSNPMTIIIDPDLSTEEVCSVTAYSGSVAPFTLTVVRGVDGTTAQAHNGAAVVKHGVSARDFADSQNHIDNTTTAHGVSGAVVGTTSTQTLTGKTIDAASNTISNIANANIAAGAAIDKTKISGTAVTLADTQTLTNKTLTSPVIGAIVNTGTLSLPTSTDTLVGRATTDTLTNKSIAAGTNTISGLTNTNLSGTAGITNANLQFSSVTIGSTAVSLGGTAATVAGLTLTSPTLNTPTVNGATINSASTIGGVSGTTIAADHDVWQAWTPTLSGSGWVFTNLVATNCRYIQIGKTVHFQLKFKATASVTIGSASLICSLPVAMRKSGGTGLDAEIAVFASTAIYDSASGNVLGGPSYTPPSTNQSVYVMYQGAAYFNSINYGSSTFPANSWFAMSGTYEAA